MSEMLHEAKIRDYLSKHLHILTPDLTLIKKEFEIKNPLGSGGFVDILAKDGLGHYVIIELKRSDQAARAALHELTKYVALCKSTLGINRDNLRAILVSTEWHELAVPFAEYLNVCEIPTEGVVIQALPNGEITSALPFVVPQIDQALQFSRAQEILLFDDLGRRDAAYDEVASRLKLSCLTDFVLLSADYIGTAPDVIFPHAIYIAFSSPLQGATSTQRKAIKRAINWESLDLPDENFLVAFGERGDRIWATLDIGYPEKLARMLQTQWRVTVAQRHGRYASNASIVSDTELISQIMMIEGGAAQYLFRTASPKFRHSWRRLKQETDRILMGNDDWTIILAAIYKSVERRRANTTVSICAYNNSDIAFALARLAGLGDFSYLPQFQVVVSGGANVTILGN